MSERAVEADPSLPADAPTAHRPEAGAPFSPARFWLVMSGIIALAVVLISFYGRFLDRTLPKPKLPVLAVMKNDFAATERSGEVVHIKDLRGKVFVVACIYTVCPHGCAAVVGEMQKLHADFGSRSDFHLVSLAVAPERDTPAFLRAYSEGIGVKPGDPWWFLTGDQKQTWAFMTDDLQLEAPKPIPPDERLNPLDFYSHDLRIVLMDRAGRVRGYYAVFHPQPEIATLMAQRLHADVRTLLYDAGL